MPEKARLRLETAIAELADARYELTLFVSGASSSSARAISNARAICEAHLDGRYDLTVVDVNQQPELARRSRVLATPALLRRSPGPVRILVGDLSDEERVLLALDVREADGPDPPERSDHDRDGFTAAEALLGDVVEALRAVRAREVDALVVADDSPGEQVFMLESADRRYRDFVETMRDGAATVSEAGIVLYANRGLAKLLLRPLSQIIGAPLCSLVGAGFRAGLDAQLGPGGTGGTIDIELIGPNGHPLPVRVGAWAVGEAAERLFCLTFADLTQSKYREALEATVAARTDELRVAIASLERSTAAIRESREETIRRLSRAVEYRDHQTGDHVERMSRYCEQLAGRLGLHAHTMLVASSMHDVGKVAVPDDVLLKPGALTAEERRTMERHTEVGRDILTGTGSQLLELAAEIAWTHHEWFDGSGYPRGLKGQDIPLEGRVAAVADVFDALTNDRPYRPALSVETTLEMMQAERGTHFDPTVLDAFMDAIDEVIAIKNDYPRATSSRPSLEWDSTLGCSVEAFVNPG